MAERMELTRPVFFVGFMGAGKTSVARRLARTCGRADIKANIKAWRGCAPWGARMAERMELTRPVFFVGFMGAGKTSVARRLARTCGVASVDMDTYIERREGKKVKEIFAEGGEEGFRAIETGAAKELGRQARPFAHLCGGGVVVTPANHDGFREAGFVVYLE